MRKTVATRLKSLVIKQDPGLLLAIRKYYGDLTTSMDQRGLYKAAKKLYTRGKL